MRGRLGRVGVIFVVTILAGCGASTGGNVGSGTGGAAPTVSSGPATMPSLGWTKANLKYPDVVAVAPSDPSTLYSCTGDPSGNPSPANSVMNFNVSHDGGTTWQTTNTLAQAGRCLSMQVSPSDPQAVAFFAQTCRQECGQAYSVLYVSLDGGAHWSAPALPSAGPILAGIAPYGWMGTTLFVALGDVPPHYLAASKNGGPFTWVTTTFAPQPFASAGNTLYALNAVVNSSACLQASTDYQTGCFELARTSDLGGSWSRILPLYQGYNVRVLAVLPDGVTMIGQETRAGSGPDVYPLLRSTDGGATWQALPDYPAGIGSNREVFAAPDGAAFTYFPGAPGASPCAIYKLLPGANAWACSARSLEPFRVVLLTWDAQGHPARVWGFVDTGSRITDLWSHPA